MATAILIATHHNAVGVAVYGSVALAIVAVCSFFLRETAHLSMAQIDEVAGEGRHPSVAGLATRS
ncbi:hypothetical protein D3C85_1721090 [compost metagenome]